MGQIIWFFDEPTILACGFCERVADHYTVRTCKECGREMIEFTANSMEYYNVMSREDEEE